MGLTELSSKSNRKCLNLAKVQLTGLGLIFDGIDRPLVLFNFRSYLKNPVTIGENKYIATLPDLTKCDYNKQNLISSHKNINLDCVRK